MADARCPAHCASWVSDYLGYCLCSTKEGVSLALGLASVFSWAIAEIPQILTNYKTKSTEGLSFAFLCTWLIGDFFNLFGCLFEPATLPTQFYIAVLYTVTTLMLTLQAIYYGHIYHRLKCNRQLYQVAKSNETEGVGVGEYTNDRNSGGEKLSDGGGGLRPISIMSQSGTTMSSPIPLPVMPRSHSAGQYTSARSLSTSHTPRKRFSVPAWGAPLMTDAENSVEEPLLGGSLPNIPVQLSNRKNLLCVVPAITFVGGALNFSYTRDTRLSVAVRLSSRKLLQVNGEQYIQSSGSDYIGTYLGWAMATVYMAGRLPQICLNIRRGHVEGLNPLMFMFALLGNTTYVASILVNSLEWSRIRPNMPWLVDAGGCALLDTFIICQFIYFQYWRSNTLEIKHEDAHLPS